MASYKFAVRVVFPIVAAVRAALFKGGMAMVRASAWSVSWSTDGFRVLPRDVAAKGAMSSSVEVFPFDEGEDLVVRVEGQPCPLRLNVDYAVALKHMLYFMAEPTNHDTAWGAIPKSQFDLFIEVCAGRWCGGATPTLLAYVEALVAEEGLIVE